MSLDDIYTYCTCGLLIDHEEPCDQLEPEAMSSPFRPSEEFDPDEEMPGFSVHQWETWGV